MNTDLLGEPQRIGSDLKSKQPVSWLTKIEELRGALEATSIGELPAMRCSLQWQWRKRA